MILQTSIKGVQRCLDAFHLMHVLSFVEGDTELSDFFALPATGHHIFRFEDDDVGPQREHIERLLEIGQGWNKHDHILIHCMAGMSRSAAASFILLCLKCPNQEAEVAQMMSRSAPNLWPNKKMVEIADELLGADGRMVSAIKAFEMNTMPEMTAGVNVFSLTGPVAMPVGWEDY